MNIVNRLSNLVPVMIGIYMTSACIREAQKGNEVPWFLWVLNIVFTMYFAKRLVHSKETP